MPIDTRSILESLPSLPGEDQQQISPLATQGEEFLGGERRAGRAYVENKGLLNEAGKGIKQWARSSASGLLTTGGSLIPGEDPLERAGKSLGDDEFRQDQMAGRGFANKSAFFGGYGLGEVASFTVPQAVAARAAGKVAAASKGFKALSAAQKYERAAKYIGRAQKATMFGVIAGRQHGNTYQQYLEDTGNPVAAHMVATFLDLGSFAIERAGGWQAFAEKGTRDAATKGLLSALDDAVSGDTVSGLARLGMKSKPFKWSTSVAKNWIEEGLLEEGAETLLQGMTKAVVTGNNDLTWKGFWDSTIQSMGVALPGALIFGSAQWMHQETEKAAARELVKRPAVQDDETRIMVGQLQSAMVKNMGASPAQASKWGDVIYNVAVNLAGMAEEETSPRKLFEELSIAILSDKQVDAERMRSAKTDEERMAYLRELAPDLDDRVYKLVDSIEAARVRTENDTLAKVHGEKYGKWYDEGGDNLSAGLRTMLGDDEIGPEGLAVYPDYSDQSTDASFWRAMYAHGIVRNINVKGKNYSARMFDDGSLYVYEDEKYEPGDDWNPVLSEQVRNRRLRSHANRMDAADDVFRGAAMSGEGQASEAMLQARRARGKATGALLLPAKGETSQTMAERVAQARRQQAEQKQAGPFVAGPGGVVPANVGENPLFGAMLDKLQDLASGESGLSGAKELLAWIERNGLEGEPYGAALIRIAESEQESQRAIGEIQEVLRVMNERKALPPAGQSLRQFVAGDDAFPATGERNPFLELPYSVVREAAKSGNVLAEEARKQLDARNAEAEQHRLKEGGEPAQLTAEQGARATLLAEEQQRPAGGWFSEAADVINAQYFLDGKLAAFYKTAKPEDVAHEWLHHIINEGFVPPKHMAILLGAYQGGGDRPDAQTEERIIGGFMRYMRDGVLPDNPQLAGTMEYIREAMRGSWQASQGWLTAESDAVFNQWFGGKAVDPQMADVGQAVAEATSEAREFDKEDDPRFSSSPSRSQSMRKIHAILSHGEAKARAAEMFGNDVSLADEPAAGQRRLTDTEIARLADEIGRGQFSVAAGWARRLFDKDLNDLDSAERAMIGRAMDYAKERRDKAKNADKKVEPIVSEDELKAVLRENEQYPRHPAVVDRARGGAGGSTLINRAWSALTKTVTDWDNSLIGGVVTDMFTDWRTMIDKLSGGNKKSVWHTDVYNTMLNAQAKWAQEHWEMSKWWSEAQSRLGRVDSKLDKKVDINGDSRTRNDILFLAMIGRGDPSRIEAQKLREANEEFSTNSKGESSDSIFEANVREAWRIANADAGMKRTMQLIEEFYAYLYEKINPVWRRVNGVTDENTNLGRVDFYLPMMREGGLWLDTDWLGQLSGITPSKIDARREAFSMMKKRVKTTGGNRIRTNLYDVLMQYRNQAAVYIGKQEALMRVGEYMTNPAVVESMRRRFGSDKVMEVMQKLLEKERFSTGRTEAMHGYEVVAKKIRSAAVLGTLGMNVPSSVRQAFSLLDWGGEVDTLTFLSGAGRLLKLLPRATMNIRRIPHGVNLLDGDPVWKKMVESGSKETLSRYDATDIDMAESMSKGWFNKVVAGVPIRDWIMLGQRVFDQVTRTAAWGATYEHEYALAITGGASQEQAHQQAFRMAEDTLGKTQPGTTSLEKVGAQTSNELVRMAIPYTSQLMKKFNYMRSQVWRPLYRAYQQTEGSGIERWAKVAETFMRSNEFTNHSVGRKMFFQYIAPVMAFGLLARGRPPKDWEELCRDMVGYNVSIIPVLGPAMSLKFLYEGWSKGNSPMYIAFWEEMSDIIDKAILAAPGDKDWKDIGSKTLYATRWAGLPGAMLRIPRRMAEWKEQDDITMLDAMADTILKIDPTDEVAIKEAMSNLIGGEWNMD